MAGEKVVRIFLRTSDISMSVLAFFQPAITKPAPAEVPHGLDWVHWLLGSVRARCELLHFHCTAASRPSLLAHWSVFANQDFARLTGPRLIEAWIAASEGWISSLEAVDAALDNSLPESAAARSLHAGAVLMKGTRGARYQGLLGHYRESLDRAGRSPHFVTAWAAVGHFFQLSLANVVAEYLRLEWELGSRHLPGTKEPKGLLSIAHLASHQLHAVRREPVALARGR